MLKTVNICLFLNSITERHLLESNISVAGQKGKVDKGPKGTQIISCNNAFDIFGKIPGTPQNWKTNRN